MSDPNPGSVYKFVNAKAGNVMDLSDGDNTTCIGYDWHDGDNQKWRLVKSSDGASWLIVSVSSGKYVSYTGNLVDGVQVVGSSTETQWDIKRTMRILRYIEMNLDLSGFGNLTPGTPIQLWTKWEGRNQCWSLEAV